MGFGGVKNLEEALAIKADQDSGVMAPHRVEAGIDSLFLTSSATIKLSDYWVDNTLKHGFWAAFSKRAFINGFFNLYAQLYTANNTSQFFGMESGVGGLTLSPLVGVHVSYGGRFRLASMGTVSPELDLGDLLPATYNTARHRYTIKVNRNNVLLYIDNVLRGVILLGLTLAIPNWESNPPYVLGGSRSPSSSGHLMLGMEGVDYTEWDLYSNGIVAVDGEPFTPLLLPLYTENTATEWNGLATAVAVTSHPVPVWGYERKTLFFQSNAAGTLGIQVYAGGAWRTYDTIVLVADTLRVYPITAEAPIARCVYTPVGTDTIAVGEIHLS